MSKKKETPKDTKVKNEITRLTNLYKDIEKNRRLSTKGLIEEAAFMCATLAELKQSINENGPVDEMPQGEYSILREHPALKSYNSMVQRYSGIIKQLTDLLPKEVKVVEEDVFDDFINTRAD